MSECSPFLKLFRSLTISTLYDPMLWGNPMHHWETDFYTPPVLGGAALFDISAPAVCMKIMCPKDPEFCTLLALHCRKGQHLPALEVYKKQSPNHPFRGSQDNFGIQMRGRRGEISVQFYTKTTEWMMPIPFWRVSISVLEAEIVLEVLYR